MPQHIISELPPEAARALREGRARDAARLLADHHPDLSLAECKAILERFLAANPDAQARLDAQRAEARLQLAAAAILLACLVVAWFLLSR